MKIAYLFETFPSPTETFLAREVEALRRRKVSLEIWALNAGNGARTIPTPPRALKVLGRERFWRACGEKMARELRENGVSHVHAAWANHLAEIAHHAAQRAGLSWSFAAHARDLWVEGGDLKSKLQSAEFAAVCTRAGETELKKFGENVIYAPHGIETKSWKWRAWQPVGGRRLLGVGRLIEKKGWLDLLDALEILDDGATSLQIVGDGPLRAELTRRAEGKRVTLRGALSQNEVADVMRWANCFVLPSRIARDGDRDGLANVLLEAAAIGLPLVTTNAASARDFVDESTGWMSEAQNPRDLARVIELVFAVPHETQRRCENARRRLENRFDVDSNVDVLKRAFEES